MWADLQTMHMTFDAIVRGTPAWNALGDFLNYWFEYAIDDREALVKDPVDVPVEATLEQQQWAAFCAASVEYLCSRDAIPCPAWVYLPIYTLAEPWYRGIGATRAHVQARLRQESPEPFARRNIYCSPAIFSTKYETAAKILQRRVQSA